MDVINKNKFIENYISGIPQIIQKELIADIETPISSLLKISNKEKYSFLLESVEGGDQRGRFSLLGCDPDLIWEVNNNKVEITSLDNNLDLSFLSKEPITSLKELLKFSKIDKDKTTPPFPVMVGYLGYPMIRLMEDIKLKNPDQINIPDAVMIRPKFVAVFDNIKDTINIMTSIYPDKKVNPEKAFNKAWDYVNAAIEKLNKEIQIITIEDENKERPITFKSNYTKEEYFKIIEKAKSYIRKGDIFQVVTSQRFESVYFLDAVTLYRSLRRLNPSPFLVNLNFDTFGLVASSPEILVYAQLLEHVNGVKI